MLRKWENIVMKGITFECRDKFDGTFQNMKNKVKSELVIFSFDNKLSS